MREEISPSHSEVILTPDASRAKQLKTWHLSLLLSRSGAVECPTICAWPHWLVWLWQQHPHQRLLSDWQETWIWQKQIGQGNAQLYQQAWKLWQHYRSVNDALSDCPDPFYQAAFTFKQTLEQHQWITHAELAYALIGRLDRLHQQRLLPKRVVLYGMDNPLPSVAWFLKALARYCEIKIQSPHNIPGHISRMPLKNPSHEMEQMAHWALRAYQSGKKKVGCLVPDIQHPTLTRIFHEVFAHRSEALGIQTCQSLLDYSLINTAILALTVPLGAMEQTQLSTLLTSAYLQSSEEDAYFAAALDYQCSDQWTIEPHNLIDQAKPLNLQYPTNTLGSRLVSLMKKAAHELGEKHVTRSYRYWANKFNHLLCLIGWPAKRQVNAHEHELYQQWKQRLLMFIELDALWPPVNYENALTTLKTLCQQPFLKTDSHAAVQIWDWEAGRGLAFDAVWMMGLDDAHFPKVHRVNPLLPLSWQQSSQVPGACFDLQYEQAQVLLKQVSLQAPEVILSYSQQEGGQILSPSCLITHYPLAHIKVSSSPVHRFTKLDWIEDDKAPRLRPFEELIGGSYLLKQQADCPFMAFAHIRLKLNMRKQPIDGISAKNKGILVHQALETFWKMTRSKGVLEQYSEHELQQKMNHALDVAFSHLKTGYKALWLEVEKQCLALLLAQWIALEKQRPDFEVLASETAYEMVLNGLKLQVRVDRIDQLATGERLIIDYKTGHVSQNSWFDERLVEPQLPLYLAMARPDCQGISFAQLKRAKMAFQGLSKKPVKIKGIYALNTKNNGNAWDEQCQRWKRGLKVLASEFLEGLAKVAPHAKSQPCRFCQLKPFCRVSL